MFKRIREYLGMSVDASGRLSPLSEKEYRRLNESWRRAVPRNYTVPVEAGEPGIEAGEEGAACSPTFKDYDLPESYQTDFDSEKAVEFKVYQDYVDRMDQESRARFRQVWKAVPVRTNLFEWIEILQRRWRDDPIRLEVAEIERFPYDEACDLFRMALSGKAFKEIFEPSFNEIKETHLPLRKKYEGRTWMTFAIRFLFYWRCTRLIGRCWKVAGWERVMRKLVAWLSLAGTLTKF